MANHFIGSQTSTFNIDSSGDTWTLGANASINVNASFGIYETPEFENNVLNINGDITVTDFLGTSPKYAILAQGLGTDINIGGDSVIHATVSIALEGVDAHLVNSGHIGAHEVAVASYEDGAIIRNAGTLEANTALLVYGGQAKVINDAGGTIAGEASGISNYGSSNLSVVNRGTISGPTQAILDYDGNARILNRGTLDGDVELGLGNDRFDNRGGTLLGDVSGGDGNDVVIIGKTTFNYFEGANEGIDTVKSLSSFILGENVENLHLLGKDGLAGTGNASANLLYGNAGNNLLKGMAGMDTLAGRGGNDRLFGGADADIFVFATGFGKDRIVDFENGVDKIDLSNLTAVISYKDLLAHHVTYRDEGVLIHAGDDALLIRDMSDADISKSDFQF